MRSDSQPATVRRTFHLPFPRHNRTAFILIDTMRCKACGRCQTACQQHVLSIISFFWHSHIHVDQSAACRGCRACISACPEQAIFSRIPPKIKPT